MPMTTANPMTNEKYELAGGDEMIATDERFWQSPPQNSSCVSLSPESCSDSCWSDDSCEQTATCPASSKYSRHNSFTPIEDTVLITLPLSCRIEKRGRTVRRSGKSVYRSMLMDATAADLPSLRQGRGKRMGMRPPLCGTRCVVSAVQPHESRPSSRPLVRLGSLHITGNRQTPQSNASLATTRPTAS